MKQLELTSAENDARLAASVTHYGLGTKSYNSSSERREIDRQRAEITAKYHAGDLKFPVVLVGPVCACRSFDLPHDISKHRDLAADWDWRTPSERRGIQRQQEPIR